MHGSLLGCCLESYVIDNDMLGAINRTIRGIEITEESPIFFFVTLLDVLMSAVFMSSSTGESRAKHRKVLITQSALVGLLTIAWLPLFWQVLNPAG